MIDKKTISAVDDFSGAPQKYLDETGEALNDIPSTDLDEPTTAAERLSSELSARIPVYIETVNSSETFLPVAISSRQSSVWVEDDVIDNIPKDHNDDMPEVALSWQYMNTFSDYSFSSSELSLASGHENDQVYQNM